MEIETNKKLGHLEGLRGFAALAVVFFHVRLYFLPGSFPDEISFSFFSISNHLFSGITDGGLAVYIFWIMSGYAISIGVFRRKGEACGKYLLESFLKRHLRLMPPVLVSAILAYLLLSGNFLFHHQAIESYELSGKSVLGSFWDFEPSLLLAAKEGVFGAFFSYNGASSYNRVFWTIGPELIGSYLVYILLALLRGYYFHWLVYGFLFMALVSVRPPLAAFLVGLAYVDYDMNREGGEKYSKLFSGFHSLGFILFKNPIVYVSLLLFFLVACGHQYGSGRVSSLVDLLAAAFVTRLAFYNQFFNQCLSSKIGLFLGRVSFGVYLTHVLVIASIGCAIPTFFPALNFEFSISLVLLVSVLSSIVCGQTMYLSVDRHSQKFATNIVSKVLGVMRKRVKEGV